MDRTFLNISWNIEFYTEPEPNHKPTPISLHDTQPTNLIPYVQGRKLKPKPSFERRTQRPNPTHLTPDPEPTEGLHPTDPCSGLSERVEPLTATAVGRQLSHLARLLTHSLLNDISHSGELLLRSEALSSQMLESWLNSSSRVCRANSNKTKINVSFIVVYAS